MRTNGWLLVSAFALVIVVSAAVVSTSAFTTVTVNRDTTVSVTADDAAMVTLVDGHPDGAFVEQTGGSTLEIDLTGGGADGANTNATIELGDPDGPITDHAFRIEHRGNVASDVTLGYALDAPGAADPGSPESFAVTLSHDAGDDGNVDAQATLSENTGSTNATVSGVEPGDPVYATVVVNTTGLSLASDLSGTLEIEAAGGA